MKNHSVFTKALFLLVFASLITLFSCRDRIYKTYEANVPIFLSEENWRNTHFQLGSSKGLTQPGKIYIKDNYLFINEFLQGIHIIDNSSPDNPVNIGFLDIHANVDMAIKDNILYADSYYDLLSFDVSDPSNPVLVDRDTNVFVFDNVVPLNGFDEDLPIAEYFPENGIVIGWEQKEITVEDDGYYYRGGFFETKMDAQINTSNVSGGISSSGSGIGGSMAKFTVYNDNLYTLQEFNLAVFDIATASNPEYKNKVNITWSAETLFPANDHLFIGTTTGMMIYSLSSPSSPSLVSTFSHITSCDPVFIYEDKAYVTLSSGSLCRGNTDQLDVIDIHNYSNPFLIKSYEMTNPKGLAIDDNTLFLCDGNDGLKIFDISDTYSITANQINHFPDIKTYDVIAYNKVLIMVGSDGIYQYDYSDINNIVELSVIHINR